MNYLSLWIGNLGVVPLFSLLAFLFLPIFLSLRALLVFVCFVLEAISISFVSSVANVLSLKTVFLSSRASNVKVFLIASACIFLAHPAKAAKTQEYFLAKGEQVELELPQLESFSIGNKEVLRSKYHASKAQLLVKGESLGFSDLVVWDKQGSKRVFHFYVVSKREQLTHFQLANDFKSLGLQVKALAFQLLVKGEIKSLQDLKLFNHHLGKNRERVINMARLSPDLAREIIAGVYLELADESQSIVCSPVGASVECVYEGLDPESPRFKRIISKYGVSFAPNSNRYVGTNFRIELKVFRTDEGEIQRLGIGLDSLGARVGDLLNAGAESLIEENFFNISKKELSSRIVTSPAILASLGASGEIQLGAEIPVPSQGKHGVQNTTWKFAGLKLKTLLSLTDTRIKLAMENELTHPAEDLIRGSKSKTEFFPKLNQYTQAFQVRYDLKSSNRQRIPGIGEVPVLKALFSSSAKNSSSQWLIGYIKVAKVEP